MIESQLGALFNGIAQGEPAMSGVDTQLAHRRGRARLRRRRAGLAGTPVLAAAVAVIVALTVGAAPSRPAPGPATGTAAPREFNPLVPYLSFGWLPPESSWWTVTYSGRSCPWTGPARYLTPATGGSASTRPGNATSRPRPGT